MFRAIFFDLDETLLDRSRSLLRFIEFQYKVYKASLKHIPLHRWQQRFVELDEKGYVCKKIIYTRLLEEFKVQSFSMQELYAHYLHSFAPHCVPMKEMEETVRSLRSAGKKVGIITNGLTEFQTRNIKQLGLLP
ncbi:HAD family hydrolase [Paenactinomyces guangxiensis]|uniref:HAD family hydrolase n=1 Tax=Paenactinomyces guangxiensis TaxID=1490290 RepID=A0A7W1WNM6_9BACL|nr:HAD family hydrolase [Paenactinomyces guangxiensis]MBA4493227.1 HAD family hydrolase [Paenactinomyces guangxiensis]MBH8589923.1 HAD family hydrolase [Paenactinomyces guangxiensis]